LTMSDTLEQPLPMLTACSGFWPSSTHLLAVTSPFGSLRLATLI
jgi:hypothetical protein